jgi:hypothetical protein
MGNVGCSCCFGLILYTSLNKEGLTMFNLQACYTPPDIVFILSLFITTLISIGAFIVLMVYLIKGALDTVKDLKQDKTP